MWQGLWWWGFDFWHTPLKDIGWTWVILTWAVAFSIHHVIKARREWNG